MSEVRRSRKGWIMVGRFEVKESIRTDPERLRPFVESHPLLARLAGRSTPERPIYLAGGAVRDAMTGSELFDIDLVVGHDAAGLGLELAHDALIHERFGTAELETGGHRVDIATARREAYAAPGALPEVEMPVPIEEDMARREDRSGGPGHGAPRPSH